MAAHSDGIPNARTAIPPAPLAEVLGSWIAGYALAADRARERLLERAKLHFLDAIGVAFGGLHSEDGFADAIGAVVDTYGSAPVAQLIGRTDRAAAAIAAFHNGSLVHSVEFDDTFTERTVHTEAVTVPVVLAVGEAVGATGAELVEAWCVGTETMLRLAAGVDATFALNESGFHTTSVFGTYGAAAAAAKLLRLDAAQTATALALCTSLTSGTNAGWGVGAARNKSIQPGWAAMAGIHAAELATHNIECARTTIDAELGLYYSHAWKTGWSREPVVADLGRRWKVLDGTFKFHAAGVMMQATLDCAEEIATNNPIRPEDVQSVRVVVPNQYTVLRARPGFFDGAVAPESAYGVTANWPYAIACVLCNGHLGLRDLKNSVVLADPVRAVASRTTFVFDEDSSVPPADQVTEVTVVTAGGTYDSRRARHSGYFADFDRVSAKFTAITSPLLPTATLDAIVRLARSLDTSSAADIAAAIARAGEALADGGAAVVPAAAGNGANPSDDRRPHGSGVHA